MNKWSDLDNLNPLDDVKGMKERVKNFVGLSPEVIEYYRNVKQLDEIYSNLDEKDKKRVRDIAISLSFGIGESIS